MTSIEGSRSRLVGSSIVVRCAAPNRLRNGRSGVPEPWPDGLAALIEQALDLAESMCMVQADGGKPNLSCPGALYSLMISPSGDWRLGLLDRSVTPSSGSGRRCHDDRSLRFAVPDEGSLEDCAGGCGSNHP